MEPTFDQGALASNRAGILTPDQALALKRWITPTSRLGTGCAIAGLLPLLLFLVVLASMPDPSTLGFLGLLTVAAGFILFLTRGQSRGVTADLDAGRVATADGALARAAQFQAGRIFLAGRRRWVADTYYCSPRLWDALYEGRRNGTRVRLYVAPRSRFAVNFEELPVAPDATLDGGAR